MVDLAEDVCADGAYIWVPADRVPRLTDKDAFVDRTEAIWRRLREGGGTLRTLGRGGSTSEQADLDSK